MKLRNAWLIVAVLVATIAVVALRTWHNRHTAPVDRQTAPRAAQPAPQVPIQDAKTIDFSSGKPVVKDDAKEKAIIEKAVREMDDATASVRFSPSEPPATTGAPSSTTAPAPSATKPAPPEK